MRAQPLIWQVIRRRLAISCLLLISTSVGLATPKASTLLIFPFANDTRLSALDWIGAGLEISLCSQLSIPGLEVMDRDVRSGLVESSDLPLETPLSRASMIRVAQLADSDFLIFGTISGTAENLKIVARILEIKSLRLGGSIEVSGALSSLPELENELAWQLISSLGNSVELARDQYRERTRKIPNEAFACYVRALHTTDEENSAKLLTRATEIYPGYSEAVFLLGRYYFLKGDCTECIRKLHPPFPRAPNYADAQFMLGNCYFHQGDFLLASRAYAAIVPLHRAAPILNNLGVAYVRLQDLERASEMLAQAQEGSRTHPIPGVNLALVKHMLGKDAEAIRLLEELMRSNPSHAMLYFALGIVRQATGDSEKASSSISRARGLGVDVEKLNQENPQTWLQIFNSWDRIP